MICRGPQGDTTRDVKTTESVRCLQSITAIYPVFDKKTESNPLIMEAIRLKLITPILDTLPDSQ
jgi:hypothetical protein